MTESVTDETLPATKELLEPSTPLEIFESPNEVVSVPEPEPVEEIQSFAEAGLDPRLLTAIAEAGWASPTPVQNLCLPFTLKGRDVAGFAQTGTGKTGVFLITLVQKLLAHRAEAPRPTGDGHKSLPFALIVCPTRELAIQIDDDFKKLFPNLGLTCMAVFGGANWEGQGKELRSGIDIVVATPGRLKDFHSKDLIDFSKTEILVCDEVDRMFDMGFIDDVEFIFSNINPSAQKLLFSATTNDRVKELAFEYLDHPEYISVNPNELTPEAIEQHALMVEGPSKFRVMLSLLREHNPPCSIIFVNTKLAGSWLYYKLQKNNVPVDLITGDLPQAKRIHLIKRIKEGQVKALIATDVASRGLHISNVTHVYNFDVPEEAANYIHRIGRTARAGGVGCSYTLVCEDYAHNYPAIQDLLGKVAPTPKWFDPEYLKTEDLSGNPFEDNFGKPEEEDDREYMRDGRDHRRDNNRDNRDSRGNQRPRGEQDRDRNRRPQRDDRDREPRENRDSQFTGGPNKRPFQYGKKTQVLPQTDQPRSEGLKPQARPTQQRPSADPMQKSRGSLWGVIKRVFMFFIGRGKKNVGAEGKGSDRKHIGPRDHRPHDRNRSRGGDGQHRRHGGGQHNRDRQGGPDRDRQGTQPPRRDRPRDNQRDNRGQHRHGGNRDHNRDRGGDGRR